MKRKHYEFSTAVSAIVWTVFAGLAWYSKHDLGTITTLGGIALMFAWMYEQSKLKD
ncbi:MAG: hypothetical protein WDZ62_02260 [Candidatus Pacearchaeota archaeon]